MLFMLFSVNPDFFFTLLFFISLRKENKTQPTGNNPHVHQQNSYIVYIPIAQGKAEYGPWLAACV